MPYGTSKSVASDLAALNNQHFIPLKPVMNHPVGSEGLEGLVCGRVYKFL